MQHYQYAALSSVYGTIINIHQYTALSSV